MKPLRPLSSAVALVTVLVAVLFVGCESDDPSVPSGDPWLVGILDKVDARGGDPIITYLLIGELEGPYWEISPFCAPFCRKAWLIVRDDTPMFLVRRGSFPRRCGVGDLAIGDTIRGWTTDIEYMTEPPQYDATRVVVVKPRSK